MPCSVSSRRFVMTPANDGSIAAWMNEGRVRTGPADEGGGCIDPDDDPQTTTAHLHILLSLIIHQEELRCEGGPMLDQEGLTALNHG